MNTDYFRYLNAELGAEFDLFAFEHPDWLEEHVPDGAVVIMQTDDSDFNKWALDLQKVNNRGRRSKPPVVLVHIRKLRQRKSRIVKAEAELLDVRKRA